ncbi:MAG: hypothetical protein AseanaTS_25400 [Candidatus Pelagadaptatus aseana]
MPAGYRARLSETRRKYIPVGSIAASMLQTVSESRTLHPSSICANSNIAQSKDGFTACLQPLSSVTVRKGYP